MPNKCVCGADATVSVADWATLSNVLLLQCTHGAQLLHWDKLLAVEGSECTVKWQTDKKPSSHSIADVFLTEAAAWAAFHSIASSDSASEAPFFFYAWGLPPGEHYSKRPNHGQERSWRAEVQSKKKYIQQIVYEPVLVSTWALTRNIWVQCTALFGTRGQMVTLTPPLGGGPE